MSKRKFKCIKKIVLLFAILAFSKSVYTQISIAGSTNICLGNLASFSFTLPAGKTASNYNWSFGDGFKATSALPKHLYKNAGSFVVQLKIKFTDGDSAASSLPVIVKNLPKANFAFGSGTDSCLQTNSICFKDNSLPAVASQYITSRLIVWGDGGFDANLNPSSKPITCHTYVLQKKHKVSFEITDTFGCKDFATREVEIVPGIEADVSTVISYPNCNTAKLCVRNQSTGAVQGAKYDWEIDGKKPNGTFIITPYCLNTGITKSVKVKLLATATNGCKNEITKNLKLIVDTIRTLTLSDTVICYGSNVTIKASYNNMVDDEPKWYLDNMFKAGSGTSYSFTPKTIGLSLGEHTVELRLSRGSCVRRVSRKFTVLGPIASIEIFNETQCKTNRKIYFVGDENYQFTPNYTYNWTLIDPKGENCIAERAKDINEYKNCNRSTDWWHKHTYTDLVNGYEASLIVKDTITGCMDKATEIVNLSDCGNADSGVNCDKVNMCQNNWLFSSQKAPNDPFLITLDSGKTWHKYPLYIDTSYLGVYDLGLIYRYENTPFAINLGEDSLQIVGDTQLIYDTFLCNNNLTVLPIIQNKFNVTTKGTCVNQELLLTFENKNFNANERIKITWGKSNKKIFTNTTPFVLDTFLIHLNSPGYDGEIKAEFTSAQGCKSSYSKYIASGVQNSLFVSNPRCTNSEICISATVLDLKTKKLWSQDTSLGSLKWIINNSIDNNKSFNFCRKFKQPGVYNLAAVANHPLGCKDTMKYSFVVQEIKANVTKDSRDFYCNQLRQFFDSSTLAFTDSGDFVKSYYWDWGEKTYNTFKKDPFKSFVGINDSVIVSHIAVSSKGCRDTISYRLNMITTRPQFSIRDTLGCNPFEVEFINTSTNTSQFLWEFGNPNNNTLSTMSDTNVKFTYRTPGTYEINLIGIDTFYNPHTGAVYYCQNTYPGPFDDKKRVTVLPSYKTGIDMPDSVCVNTSFTINSLSDTGFLTDIWNLGDGSSQQTLAGQSINHSYNTEGVYTVKIFPSAPRIVNQPYCHDSFAQREITVLNIKADFVIDSQTIHPFFFFTNLSVPSEANWVWDYGQPSSGKDNTSYEKWGYHNYGGEKGDYEVCLTATNSIGCKDVTCKWIFSSYYEYLQLYNTFTPETLDGKNDEFDIEIEGEIEYHLSIYNRYGISVFKGNKDAENGDGINWNGRINNTGEKCASGSYFYTFSYKFGAAPKQKRTVNGVITLLR